jgi:hypothetical protein
MLGRLRGLVVWQRRRCLVVAQTKEDRMTQVLVDGPFSIFHLGHQFRFDPLHWLVGLRRNDEG